MQPLFSYLAANPWIWLVVIAGLAVWIGALLVIFKSGKFRRRWLWVLLSLVTFSYGWQPVPGMTISVGAPIGALYILWFWRFGPAPSKADLARDTEARARNQMVRAPHGKVRALRLIYWAAAAACEAMAWLSWSGAITKLFLSFGAGTGAPPDLADSAFTQITDVGGGIFMAAFGGLFAFLSFRPYWWGKLLCAWAGLAWSMFGLMNAVMGGWRMTGGLVLAAGLTMVFVGIAHQIIDPRFGGSHLRDAAAT